MTEEEEKEGRVHNYVNDILTHSMVKGINIIEIYYSDVNDIISLDNILIGHINIVEHINDARMLG
jgi:hypothetical protein